jgi:NADP-dependent 3-hydroxy acid dehydrogenase YdfG
MSKTIAVVGAGPGVGLGVAEKFGSEGFRVALISRDAGHLADLARQLQARGIEAAGFPADVRDRPALAAALAQAAARLGPIDVLEYGPVPPREAMRTPRLIDVAAEQVQLDVAVLGAITAVQAVLPGMLAQRAGTLLFTTAASAQYPVPMTASFGVAAGALLNYVRLLHQDLKAEGIHAGIVAIAGLVVRPGEDAGKYAGHGLPAGLPLLSPQDVAQAHWALHTGRDRVEAFVGNPGFAKALAGL